MFKTAVDKYLLATVTCKSFELVQAFCTVFQPTQSEKENRAKVIQAQATLAKSFARVQVGLHMQRCYIRHQLQLNDSTTWACEADPEAKADADIAARKESRRFDMCLQRCLVDLAGLNETADKIKRELASTDYFFNTHSASDYFDGLRRVAGYLDVVMRAVRALLTYEESNGTRKSYVDEPREPLRFFLGN